MHAFDLLVELEDAIDQHMHNFTFLQKVVAQLAQSVICFLRLFVVLSFKLKDGAFQYAEHLKELDMACVAAFGHSLLEFAF